MSAQTEPETNFEILYRKKGDRVALYAPALGLLAQGADATAVFEDLLEQQATLTERVGDAGFPPPDAGKRTPGDPEQATGGLSVFLIKTIIVSAFVLLLLAVAGAGFNAIAKYQTKQLVLTLKKEAPYTGRVFWGRVEKALHEAAKPEGELPPEKMDKLVTSLRTLVTRIKPFTDELRPLFDAPPGKER